MQSSNNEMVQELQNGGGACHDDFFDQMMSGLGPAWAHGLGNSKSLFGAAAAGKSPEDPSTAQGIHYDPCDKSSLLAARIGQQQASGDGSSATESSVLLQLGHHQQVQQQMLLQAMGQPPPAGIGSSGRFLRSPLSHVSGGSGDSGFLADRSRGEIDAPFKSSNSTEAEAVYNNGFGGSLQRTAQSPTYQQLLHHTKNSATAAGIGQAPTTTAVVASAAPGEGTAPPRPRLRARRGQATDPHSIAERMRRERIAERMKALQELVPIANKADKATMLDEIIDYVKFLQLQVKVLSMSRLGGAAAVAPFVADMSSESGANGVAGNDGSLAAAEHQVAKLLEEDMGSAMQYLQGKGLCLMPMSLASAISSAACHPRPPGLGQLNIRHATGDAPPSPSISALTVQSSNGAGSVDADVSRTSGSKDGASIP